MSEDVEIFETGPSSGSSTPRHGSSPSPAQDLQWYEYDLQLAAELGKALLERNQDLESQLSDAEETMQTQQTEIQFLVQKLDSVKNINETRMRIYEQVDNNAQDLEVANRQLRHQLSVEQQTINRLTCSLKEAETRCEKLENDIYDMKRELAEETKRFRDKWRDAKKKERRTSNESMESDVDADDFILLGDAVRGDVAREKETREGTSGFHVVAGEGEDDAREEVSQMADSLQWYQAETEKLTKQLLTVEKKLAVLNAEYRSDICLKMEENKSLTMMLERLRSKTLGRVSISSSDEDVRRVLVDDQGTVVGSTRTVDPGNASRQKESSTSPNVEVAGWCGERRHLVVESCTPTTPTPTSSSCCSSGKVTRNVSFGEVTSLSSVADSAPTDEEVELRPTADDVPEVVRRSIDGKAAQRRLSEISGVAARRSLSREDRTVSNNLSKCRQCGVDLGDVCQSCHAKRISLDFEVDEGAVRAVDDLPLRASYRIAKLRDGGCAYGSQNTLERIGGGDFHGPGSRRGSVSLMSEIGAQYYRLVEKYESLLLRRAENSLGQLTETDEAESEDEAVDSVYFADTDVQKSLPSGTNVRVDVTENGVNETDSAPGIVALPSGTSAVRSTSVKDARKFEGNKDLTMCNTCQTLGDFFSDVSFHNVFFCAIFVYSLPKFALMCMSFVLTLILHSKAFKRLFHRSAADEGMDNALPPSNGLVRAKRNKRNKRRNEISPTSRPFLIPEWSRGADGGSGGEGAHASNRLMTSTPLKHSSTPSSSDGVASLSKPRDLHLPTSESATREQSFIGHFQIGRIDIEGISPSAHSACPRNDASSALSRLPENVMTPPSLMDQPESIPLTSTTSTDAHGFQPSLPQKRSSTHAVHEYASASPSPSKLIAIESLPSSQSESSILQTAPVSPLVQSSTMFKPQLSSDWCGISRSVQTELASSTDASSKMLNQENSSLRSEVVLRNRRGRSQHSHLFDGNRTSIAAPTSSSNGNVPSRKCRSLILDEMLERSVFVEKKDESFSGFDRSPPEYRELFKEIFATLKRTVDREMGRPPTSPMASSV